MSIPVGWTRIHKPFMWGLQITRWDGITVEVVECERGAWDLFMTRDDNVVACSLEAHRQWGNGYTSMENALRVGKRLLDEGVM